MNRVRIVTDNAADLPEEIAKKYGIEIAEMDVSFGDEVFHGGRGITLEEFYARMKKEKELPKTSCPSPDQFMEIYKKDESDVLVLTLTSKLSGTYNSATLAESMYNEENPRNRVKVIDTKSGTIGQSLLTVLAAQLAKNGKNIDEIASEVEKYIDKTRFMGALQTLENAIKGGRISKLAGSIINTFNFKALVKVDDGLVVPFDKARGENASMKKLVDLFLKDEVDTEKKTLFIGHSNCLEKAEKLKSMILDKKEFREVVFCPIGTAMGTYTSDGCVLLNSLELPEMINE